MINPTFTTSSKTSTYQIYCEANSTFSFTFLPSQSNKSVLTILVNSERPLEQEVANPVIKPIENVQLVWRYNVSSCKYESEIISSEKFASFIANGGVVAVRDQRSLLDDIYFDKCRIPSLRYYVSGGLLGGSKWLMPKTPVPEPIKMEDSINMKGVDIHESDEDAEEDDEVDDDEYEDYYGLICERTQLTYLSMSAFPDGLYYVDIQNCFHVNGVQEGYNGPVYQLTETFFTTLTETPNTSYYVTVSRGLGGNKKAKIIARQAKNTIRKIVNTGKKVKKVADFVSAVAGAGKYKVKSNKKRKGKKRIANGNHAFFGKGFYSSGYGVSGSGAYNTLINPEGSPMHIAHRRDETGDVCFSYSEYVMDVYSGGTPFQNIKYSVNPGLSWFSFLSQLAEQFEQYSFEQLIFKYVPTVTNVTATGQLGSVIMAFKYNASDPLFLTKQQMMGYSGAINDVISQPLLLGVECDPRKGAAKELYIRAGSVPSGQDIKTYDLGALYLGTAGVNTTSFPSGTQIGELHVMYTIRLMKPRIFATVGGSVGYDAFVANIGLTTTPFNLFGSSPMKGIGNSIGCSVSKQPPYNIVTFPDNVVGYFDIYFVVYGTGFTGLPNISLFGNLSWVPGQYNGSWTNTMITANSTTSVIKGTLFVQYPLLAGGNYFQFISASMTGTSFTASQLFLSQLNPTIPTNNLALTPA